MNSDLSNLKDIKYYFQFSNHQCPVKIKKYLLMRIL